LLKNNFKSKLLLQVHDELVFDVFKEELKAIQPIVKKEMENAVKLIVPLTVEMNKCHQLVRKPIKLRFKLDLLYLVVFNS